ncbi:hypothetical protein L505_3610 [Bordetella bronchiseptica F4563]|nr:hypothetical protein L505_3610 [Bordetella bronchiseptica F4563]
MFDQEVAHRHLTAGPAAPAAGARPEARPAGGPRAKAAAGR